MGDGTLRAVVPLSASWPRSLRPQQNATPSLASAHVCSTPVVIVANFTLVATALGALRLMVDPSPS
jgi:hypothetical protein